MKILKQATGIALLAGLLSAPFAAFADLTCGDAGNYVLSSTAQTLEGSASKELYTSAGKADECKVSNTSGTTLYVRVKAASGSNEILMKNCGVSSQYNNKVVASGEDVICELPSTGGDYVTWSSNSTDDSSSGNFKAAVNASTFDS